MLWFPGVADEVVQVAGAGPAANYPSVATGKAASLHVDP
jgi:hypothetical protein